jgi:hypothetical protein
MTSVEVSRRKVDGCKNNYSNWANIYEEQSSCARVTSFARENTVQQKNVNSNPIKQNKGTRGFAYYQHKTPVASRIKSVLVLFSIHSFNEA